jgi:hypothetical protein
MTTPAPAAMRRRDFPRVRRRKLVNGETGREMPSATVPLSTPVPAASAAGRRGGDSGPRPPVCNDEEDERALASARGTAQGLSSGALALRPPRLSCPRRCPWAGGARRRRVSGTRGADVSQLCAATGRAARRSPDRATHGRPTGRSAAVAPSARPSRRPTPVFPLAADAGGPAAAVADRDGEGAAVGESERRPPTFPHGATYPTGRRAARFRTRPLCRSAERGVRFGAAREPEAGRGGLVRLRRQPGCCPTP